MGFFERLSWALKVLFSAEVAKLLVQDAPPHAALPEKSEEPATAPPPVDTDALVKAAREEGALIVLSVLQREGRLLDFVQEDVTSYPDADVGAAARAVHEGCKKAVGQLCGLGPVRAEAEESQVTVPAGFDPTTVKLTGNVTGQPPYTGTLVHAGWKANAVTLPARDASHDDRVLAPAEVEL